MDKEKVIAQAKNILSNLQPVSNSVYKGELIVTKEEPAAIYYIDLGDQEGGFDDFQDYQERLLADEYYSKAGSLQWNYYLLILRDKFDQAFKKQIEANEKYARKFIFTQDEFEDYFSLIAPSESAPLNIVSEWRNRLDTAGLSSVYSGRSYTESIDQYISEASVSLLPDHSEEVVLPTANIDDIKMIAELKLKENFRDHPQNIREFKFGKVNLFYGKNGAGKTSVLEGIEAFVCGKTMRNISTSILDDSIVGKINKSDTPISVTPSNLELYRLRDNAWYSNPYSSKSKNELYLSFNRYNYFNADAAFLMSRATAIGEIRSSLLNLIMGPEYSYVIERVTGFYDRLKPIYNKLANELSAAQKREKELLQFLEQNFSSSSLTTLFNSIQELMAATGFKFNLKSEEDLIQGEQQINVALVSLQNMASRFQLALAPITVTEKHKHATQKRITYESLVEDYDSLLKGYKDNELTIATKEDLLSVLEGSLKYFQNNFLQAEGLDNKISHLRILTDNTNRVKSLIGDFVSDQNQTESLDLRISNLVKENSDLENQLRSVEARINLIQNTFNRIQQIVAEIKDLGSEYVTINSADRCPLCHSDFPPGTLKEKIKQLDEVTKENIELNRLYEDKVRLKNHIEKNDYLVTQLKNLLEAYQLSSSTAEFSPSSAIAVAYKQVQSYLEKYADSNDKLASLVKLKENLKSSNCSEQELNTLKTRLNELYGTSLVLLQQNEEIFTTTASQTAKEISELVNTNNHNKEKRRVIGNEIKALLERPETTSLTRSEAEEILTNEENKFKEYRDVLSTLSTVIDVKPDVPLDATNFNIELLTKYMGTYRREREAQLQIKNSEAELKEVQKIITTNTKPTQKLKLAVDTLFEIQSDKASDHLEQFFSSNLEDVSDVFRTIHMPNEFARLEYDNHLELITKTGKRRELTEISTGQRSALALSIFISLNRRLRRGPDILMFDDPVANVDDLNLLSFLDFLRLFIVKEQKQIFFATSNTRVSTLFKRKFDFLGDDFKFWELYRMD